MTLPSKELMSEVLGYEVTKVSLDDTQSTPYVNVYINNEVLIYDGINIYELAHKCKERALEQGYFLYSVLVDKEAYAFVTHPNNTSLRLFSNHSKTEQEAIFKCYEWIMEQTK